MLRHFSKPSATSQAKRSVKLHPGCADPRAITRTSNTPTNTETRAKGDHRTADEVLCCRSRSISGRSGQSRCQRSCAGNLTTAKLHLGIKPASRRNTFGQAAFQLIVNRSEPKRPACCLSLARCKAMKTWPALLGAMAGHTHCRSRHTASARMIEAPSKTDNSRQTLKQPHETEAGHANRSRLSLKATSSHLPKQLRHQIPHIMGDGHLGKSGRISPIQAGGGSPHLPPACKAVRVTIPAGGTDRMARGPQGVGLAAWRWRRLCKGEGRG